MAGNGTNQIVCGGDAVTDPQTGNITGSTNDGFDIYIVAMRGYGENIEGGGGHISRDCLAQEPRSREQSDDAPPFPLTSVGLD